LSSITNSPERKQSQAASDVEVPLSEQKKPAKENPAPPAREDSVDGITDEKTEN